MRQTALIVALLVVSGTARADLPDSLLEKINCTERKCNQLYEFNPKTKVPPVLFSAQDASRAHNEMAWTPDGKRLIVISY